MLADEGLSGGPVAGIVIACITFISIIIFIIFYFDKKKKTGRTDAEMFRAGWESIKSKFHCNTSTSSSSSSNTNAVELLRITPSTSNTNNNTDTSASTGGDQAPLEAAPLEAAARPAPPSYFEAKETALFPADQFNLKDESTTRVSHQSSDAPNFRRLFYMEKNILLP